MFWVYSSRIYINCINGIHVFFDMWVDLVENTCFEGAHPFEFGHRSRPFEHVSGSWPLGALVWSCTRSRMRSSRL